MIFPGFSETLFLFGVGWVFIGSGEFNFLTLQKSVLLHKTSVMHPKNTDNDDFSKDDARRFAQGSLREYGVYSVVVFQMLATIALGFWGGKKLNDYWEIKSNLVTIAIGFTGMALAFYSLLRQLKNIQKNENQK